MTNEQVVDMVVKTILEALDKGISPWHKGWHGGSEPCSAKTGRKYRGINRLLLGFLPYETPKYLTFKQCQELGGRVKKGEKSHLIVLWKPCKKEEELEDGTKKTRNFMLMRHFNVFNVAQCEGLPEEMYKNSEGEKEHKPIEEAEAMWAKYDDKPNTVFTNNDAAFYVPSMDVINVPKMGLFDSPEEFYATLFHEGIHSTGHESRLNRDLGGGFGSEKYSCEELTAEIGAQILCQMCGIESTLENSAAYCKSWAKHIRNSPKKEIISAAQRAQKAVDYIMGVKHDSDCE